MVYSRFQISVRFWTLHRFRRDIPGLCMSEKQSFFNVWSSRWFQNLYTFNVTLFLVVVSYAVVSGYTQSLEQPNVFILCPIRTAGILCEFDRRISSFICLQFFTYMYSFLCVVKVVVACFHLFQDGECAQKVHNMSVYYQDKTYEV